MISKKIIVPEVTTHNEPTSVIVRPGYHDKIASVRIDDPISHALSSFRGERDRTYILVVAVSPVEYYGDNRNHDYFREYWLKKNHPTFVQKGTFYRNHVNKDPRKNFGENVLSFYDDVMKRVLVLVGLDHNKCPDLVQRAERGDVLKFSMGCNIDYDVCDICGNNAHTRADYCDHMKYQAGQILPDGRKVRVDNPNPTFFDLSEVVRPAGPIEYIIKIIKPTEGSMSPLVSVQKKTASLILEPTSSELFAKESVLNDKFAMLKKLNAIEKTLEGESIPSEELSDQTKATIKMVSSIPSFLENDPLPNKEIEALSSCPLKHIMTTAKSMDMNLLPSDISRILFIKIKKKDPEAQTFIQNLDDHACPYNQFLPKATPFSSMLDNPNLVELMHNGGFMDSLPEEVSSTVASIISPFLERKSVDPKVISVRIVTKLPSSSVQEDTMGDEDSIMDMMKSLVGGSLLFGASHMGSSSPAIIKMGNEFKEQSSMYDYSSALSEEQKTILGIAQPHSNPKLEHSRDRLFATAKKHPIAAAGGTATAMGIGAILSRGRKL